MSPTLTPERVTALTQPPAEVATPVYDSIDWIFQRCPELVIKDMDAAHLFGSRPADTGYKQPAGIAIQDMDMSQLLGTR
ncbi:MAG: hypothetical protein F6K19_37730 [Cyanothece sp. SIO1E1]|nr:hypothetical protein [Cyanothece sp. SIO1E1]